MTRLQEIKLLGSYRLYSEDGALLGSFSFTNVRGSENAAKYGAEQKRKALKRDHGITVSRKRELA